MRAIIVELSQLSPLIRLNDSVDVISCSRSHYDNARVLSFNRAINFDMPSEPRLTDCKCDAVRFIWPTSPVPRTSALVRE
jgi:hypothetical protein